MKLSEVFFQLTYGELSQLNLGGAELGTISTENYPIVMAHINLGLTALYSRFALKEGRVTFTLQEGRVVYSLSTDEDIVFVDELGTEEFADDILKIEGVYVDSGTELSLNDKSDVYSCFTPSESVLRVSKDVVNKAVDLPVELLTDNLLVVYRANHPKLLYTGMNFTPSKVVVELPYSHLEALLFYVASRVHNPIGMTNEFHAGNSYAAKYEKACQMLELKSLQVDQGSQNNKLEAKGFV